jgi:tRNA threonylcarbamoyl adenosine modification protein YjeE
VTVAAPESAALADEEATELLGGRIAASLLPGDLVLLEGPLGAGKTTLVRGLVRALGGDPSDVCSPTFVLLETYAVGAGPIERVHHADLYRLRGRESAPIEEVGLGDAVADESAITAIEWPESWPWLRGLAGRVLRIRLAAAGDGRVATLAWA